jgi:hypothetical protein
MNFGPASATDPGLTYAAVQSKGPDLQISSAIAHQWRSRKKKKERIITLHRHIFRLLFLSPKHRLRFALHAHVAVTSPPKINKRVRVPSWKGGHKFGFIHSF